MQDKSCKKKKKLPFATFHVSHVSMTVHQCTAMHFPHAITNSRTLTPCSFSLSPAGELGFVIEAAIVAYMYTLLAVPQPLIAVEAVTYRISGELGFVAGDNFERGGVVTMGLSDGRCHVVGNGLWRRVAPAEWSPRARRRFARASTPRARCPRQAAERGTGHTWPGCSQAVDRL